MFYTTTHTTARTNAEATNNPRVIEAYRTAALIATSEGTYTRVAVSRAIRLIANFAFGGDDLHTIAAGYMHQSRRAVADWPQPCTEAIRLAESMNGDYSDAEHAMGRSILRAADAETLSVDAARVFLNALGHGC